MHENRWRPGLPEVETLMMDSGLPALPKEPHAYSQTVSHAGLGL